MIKYIAYCRKSTDEKDKQVLSIAAQIAELKEFAKRENLTVTEFITESKTAKVPGREQFAEVLKKIEKGMANAILSWHPDRLARNSIDGGKVIYLLDTGKLLDLKFPSFWFESTPQGKFMLSIAFGQSKYYVDNLSENVKRGNRQKLRNGVWPSKAPYGYTNNPKTRGIDVDEEKSKVVRKAFQLFADGNISFTAISQFMFKFGIRREGEKPVKVGQVKNMLSNRFYLGILKYAGEYYQGSHKTFISKKLFDEVQKQVEKIERPRQKGHNFAFAGLATCGECGAAITAEQHIKKYKNGTGQTFIYYRCTKKLKPCTQKYISEPDTEIQLRKIVRDCGLHQEWEPYFEKWVTEAEERDKLTVEVEEKQLDGQLQESEVKLNRLLDGYLDQVVEPEIYKQKKNELFDEKLKLEEKKSQIEKNGTVWLEPMREFVNCALQAQKIAREKNKCHDLAIVAKKVGSNFFLMNRRLSANLNYAFAALSAEGGAASVVPTSNSISFLVMNREIELMKQIGGKFSFPSFQGRTPGGGYKMELIPKAQTLTEFIQNNGGMSKRMFYELIGNLANFYRETGLMHGDLLYWNRNTQALAFKGDNVLIQGGTYPRLIDPLVNPYNVNEAYRMGNIRTQNDEFGKVWELLKTQVK